MLNKSFVLMAVVSYQPVSVYGHHFAGLSLPAGRLMAYHDRATENEIIFASASSSDDRISEARQDAGGQTDRRTGRMVRNMFAAIIDAK